MQKPFQIWASFLVMGLLHSFSSQANQCQNSFDSFSGITPAWVEKMMEDGKARSDQAKRIRNTIQNDGIKTLISNRGLLALHNSFYTMEIPGGLITDQKATGKCWIFAGLNVVRSQLRGDGKISPMFEFSSNYLYFFSLLEKSNTYLETIINAPSKSEDAAKTRSRMDPSTGDEGWWNDFIFLVKKYGIVPKEAMPETYSSEQTAELQSELQKHLGAIAYEIHSKNQKLRDKTNLQRKAELRDIKEKKLRGIWKILASHLGDPPTEFEIKHQEYIERKDTHNRVENYREHSRKWDPRTYRDSFRFNLEDYITVTANPLKEENRVYRTKDSSIGKALPGKPAYNLRRLNLNNEALQILVEKSITAGEPVWFAADVFKDIDPSTGILHPSLKNHEGLYDFKPNEKPKTLSAKIKQWLRIGMPTHAMAIVGIDRPNRKESIVKFKVENSWGMMGDMGYFHMYREWFEEHVYEVIIHKSLLSEDQFNLWNGSAEVLEKSDGYY